MLVEEALCNVVYQFVSGHLLYKSRGWPSKTVATFGEMGANREAGFVD